MKKLELNSVEDLKKEGKSFYWASFFLPRHSRIKAGHLYSICRYYDNIADMDKEDKSIFLKNSIEEIKNNKENVVNIFLQQNSINNLIFIHHNKQTHTNTKKNHNIYKKLTNKHKNNNYQYIKKNIKN